MTLVHLLSIFFALFLGFGLKESRRRNPDFELGSAFFRVIRIVFGRSLILLLAFNILSAALDDPFLLTIDLLSWEGIQRGLTGLMMSIVLVTVFCLLIGTLGALLLAGVTGLVSLPFLYWREDVGYVMAVVFATLQVHALVLLQQAGQLI